MKKIVSLIGMSLLSQLPLGAQAGVMQTTYSCVDQAGVATLTNVPSPGATCEALYTTEVAETANTPARPATVAAADTAAAPARSSASSSHSAAKPADPKDAEKKAAAKSLAKAKADRDAASRKDAAVRETLDAYARGAPKDGNPAVARRYLKTDRATYMQQNGITPR